MTIKPEDIDWSKAPSDATHCVVAEYPDYYCWEKHTTDGQYYWSYCADESFNNYEWEVVSIGTTAMSLRTQHPVSPSEAPNTKDIQSQLEEAKRALKAAQTAIESIEGAL